MVTIRIGDDSRRLEDADESWITQQIVNRQREGLPVCVRSDDQHRHPQTYASRRQPAAVGRAVAHRGQTRLQSSISGASTS
jgi:hypothetical protein